MIVELITTVKLNCINLKFLIEKGLEQRKEENKKIDGMKGKKLRKGQLTG